MEQLNSPVDVISVCSANGEIRPLRLRLEAEDHRLLRVDIDEIISNKNIQYVEALYFGVGPEPCQDNVLSIA